MCTMSWILADDGYTVFFNRDEAKTRSLAEWPKIQQRNGMRLIAPRDPDGGGTWMGANENGVTCCLLNNYGPKSPIANGKPISRGLLVSAMLELDSQQAMLNALDKLPLGEFRPFWLTIFEPKKNVVLAGWDGRQLRMTDRNIPFPITSSSVQSHEVEQHRRAALPDHIDEQTLLYYHSSHFQGNLSKSVCTHRAFSETVSLSRVRISAHKIEYFYIPGAPCRTSESATITLHRKQQSTDSRTQDILSRLMKMKLSSSAFRRFPNR